MTSGRAWTSQGPEAKAEEAEVTMVQNAGWCWDPEYTAAELLATVTSFRPKPDSGGMFHHLEKMLQPYHMKLHWILIVHWSHICEFCSLKFISNPPNQYSGDSVAIQEHAQSRVNWVIWLAWPQLRLNKRVLSFSVSAPMVQTSVPFKV